MAKYWMGHYPSCPPNKLLGDMSPQSPGFDPVLYLILVLCPKSSRWSLTPDLPKHYTDIPNISITAAYTLAFHSTETTVIRDRNDMIGVVDQGHMAC